MPHTEAAPSLRGVSRLRSALSLPAATCDFTILSFSLSGTGSVGASRPFTVTQDDTFEQFILPPITATVVASPHFQSLRSPLLTFASRPLDHLR